MIDEADRILHVPLRFQSRRGRKVIVWPEGQAIAPVPGQRGDPSMVKALARAYRWKRMLDEGRYGSITEIAAAEKIDRGYIGTVIRLTLLAPDIVEAILDGRQPEGLGLTRLLQPWPLEWEEQRRALTEVTYA